MSRASANSTTGRDDSASSTSLPIITQVDPDSPAEQSGLKAGDIVLEINGKSTHGQPNSVIANLIRSAGRTIDFTVSRLKSPLQIAQDDLLREKAKQITETVVESALAKLPAEQTPVLPQRRLSRKESASLHSNKSNSPQLAHTEVRMSSSKFQDSSSPALSANRVRNQSEPISEQIQLQKMSESVRSSSSINSNNNQVQIQSSSPISRRSSSSFTLPRDAPIPRLCRVRAYEDQLGFTVAGSRASRGVFKVNDVAVNSPAAHSGLQNDDFIIEISGLNVENMDYADVVNYIKQKKQEDDLQLLVVDRATLQWYKAKKIPISSQIVPRMQYIETLLKEELDRELNESNLDQNDQCRILILD